MKLKDLERDELKKSFKENIIYALKNAKNSALHIIFKFSGIHQGEYFKFKEVIDYFAGYFKYKNVYLNCETVDTDTIINIIVDNFSYDCFNFVDRKEKIGKIECHGFGDYWGEDKFTFIYQRVNCI